MDTTQTHGHERAGAVGESKKLAFTSLAELGNSARPGARPTVTFALLLSVLFLIAAAVLPAQDYQVFGDVEGVSTYHYLEDAEVEHRLTGVARLRADHRLTFERADFVADTELELRSPGAPEPGLGLEAVGSGGSASGSGVGSGDSELDYYIDEAYLTLFPLSPVTVTAGKQRVNWGTGYTFTPTDTLHPRSTEERDAGFRGLSVTYTPTADLALSAHLSADDALDDPSEDAHEGLRYALYGSAFLGNVELVASGVYGPNSTLRPALAASADVGGVVLAAEGAVEFLNPIAYPEGDLAQNGFETPEAGTPHPLALFAVEYNAARDILDFATISEYLFAGTGYTEAEAGDLLDAFSAVRSGAATPSAAARATALGKLDPDEQPVFLGRHYLSQTFTLGIAGYVELESGLVMNAVDLSYEAEQTVRVTAIGGVDFFVSGRWYGGDEDTEFGTYIAGSEPPGRVQLEIGSTVHF